MRVSWQWLSEWIDLGDMTPEALAERLTAAGVAVEQIIRRGEGIAGVLVARVLDVRAHPNADRLKVVTVETAFGGPTHTVVTGAPDVEAGAFYPYAAPGARLAGGVRIERQAFRGVVSEGMLCSAEELGMEVHLLSAEARSGLYRLPDDAPLGADAVGYLGLDDVVLELDLTPNRADCLSIIGVAYEAAAILDRPLRRAPEAAVGAPTGTEKAPGAPAVGEAAKDGGGASAFAVTVEDDDLCPLYLGQIISGIVHRPAPQWMQNRLLASGIRPINAVVDVTNYVMLEYGQPLHAFDADRIGTERIVVRRAKEGETLTTLDGKERLLTADDLVITDGVRPIGLAGVMGGEHTEVTPETRRIFLESAYFAGPAIRRTAVRFDLRSEASRRFEKGVDPLRVLSALKRAAELIAALAGGRVEGGVVGRQSERAAALFAPRRVEITRSAINARLGTALTQDEVLDVFRRLGFPYSVAVAEATVDAESGGERLANSEERVIVTVPTRRGDIAIAEDLIEEVARLVGYEAIPSTAPKLPETVGGRPPLVGARRSVAEHLAALGLHEVHTYVLVSEDDDRRFPRFDARTASALSVRQPMNAARRSLRRSLMPGLLEVAAYNRRHRVDSGRFFEIGKVFHPVSDEAPYGTLPDEPLHVAAVFYGHRPPVVGGRMRGGASEAGAYDYYAAKGVVEALLARYGLKADFVPAADLPGLHPSRAARVVLAGETACAPSRDGAQANGEPPVVLGWVGELNPSVAEAYELTRPAAFELSLTRLIAHRPPSAVYSAPPRFPGVRRDISFWIDRSITHADVLQVIRSAAEQLTIPLTDVVLFDVYEGDKSPSGKKSMAYALTFRHPERTLLEEEADAATSHIVRTLEQRLSIALRA
ncbi:MAG: phenylalanine--tRNA ligase subunit beta [Hydrogenibacillus sp.]|nr:phenylalanine--tRNA ligase subunit beta [Hydrogenibacillus sp.]